MRAFGGTYLASAWSLAGKNPEPCPRSLPSGCSAPQDVKVYILNPDTLAEVPSGEVGEVYLCSRQLAVGYNNRPEANEEKFKVRVCSSLHPG